MTLAMVLTACVGLGVAATLLGLAWCRRRSDGGDQRDDEGGEGGGGRWWRGDRPPAPRPPSDEEPPWWPQFERELAAYMARRAPAGHRS